MNKLKITYRMQDTLCKQSFKFCLTITLSLALAFTAIPRPLHATSALPERNLSTPSQWYWLTGVTTAQVKQQIDQGYRIFDLEIESTSPYKFSVVMIKNEGVHESRWWWYYGKSSDEIKDLLSKNEARIIDMEIYYVGGQKRYGVVMVPNTGSNAKSWWYYSALTGDQVGQKLTENQARMVDFDTYVQGGKRYYTAVMIANERNDAKSWWYYPNLTATQVEQKLSTNKARITDIEVRDVQNGQPIFMVVMEKLQGEYWWWYYGKTMNQVNELANQNGARIIDITPYTVAGKKRFAVAMLLNVNDQTNRIRKYLDASQNGGSYGGYVKRVGGGGEEVHLQPDKAFYPASTIKVLEHVYAMRQVQMDKAKLTDKVTKYDNASQSCADSHSGHQATKVSLETILKTMMEKSDNQSTNAVQEHFGDGNAAIGRSKINTMARMVLRLSNQTKINHKLGCGGPTNNPENSLTLRDVARIYEKVAGGVLTGSHKTKFYELMLVGKGSTEDIADQEGKKLGLSSSAINTFKEKIKSAAKAGNFTSGGKQYSNIGGWVALPTKNGQTREYVYGYFRDGASVITQGKGAWEASAEMLREQIRSALQTY